jgi:hypothetical protein
MKPVKRPTPHLCVRQLIDERTSKRPQFLTRAIHGAIGINLLGQWIVLAGLTLLVSSYRLQVARLGLLTFQCRT